MMEFRLTCGDERTQRLADDASRDLYGSIVNVINVQTPTTTTNEQLKWNIYIMLNLPIHEQFFSMRNIVEIANILKRDIPTAKEFYYDGAGNLSFTVVERYFNDEQLENVVKKYVNDNNDAFSLPQINIGRIM